jgi:hypothetical protein
LRSNPRVFGGHDKFEESLKAGLLEFAENELEMGADQGAGGSLRDNLISVWEQTGIKPDELVEVDCPEGIKHVWGHFLELHRSRGMGAASPNPISYQDILAWSQLTKNDPTPFEVSCLTSLDALWLSTLNKD